MSKQYQISRLTREILSVAAVLCLGFAPAFAQTAAPQATPAPQSPPQQTTPPGKPEAQAPAKSKSGSAAGAETHITPDEAKELFGLVDQLLKFSSQETGLPIKSDVKRQLTTRSDVERYL